MENTEQETGSHMSEPVRTPENPLEYEWLTVDQAVAFCAERGLTRTPKTLRKWAERSYNKEDAEIVVRREDTMWAYRWKIEKTSLARKIDEELSLAQTNAPAPVRTSAHIFADGSGEKSSALQSEPNTNPVAPVRTGADEFGQSDTETAHASQNEPSADVFEPVRTGATTEAVGALHEELRERIKDKDAEIAFLREQLERSQAEVGRRAGSTDEALKTIDRIVHSFELQAEANKALALQSASEPTIVKEATEPIPFTPQSMTDAETGEPKPEPAYQQEPPVWRRV